MQGWAMATPKYIATRREITQSLRLRIFIHQGNQPFGEL
jgi:hypothetical protein